MIKIIRDLVWACQYKKAVRKADRMRSHTGRKHCVFLLDGRLRVVPKKRLKQLLASHRFKRGVTMKDIESHCLYITR